MKSISYEEFQKLVKDLFPKYLSEIVKDFNCKVESVPKSTKVGNVVQISVCKSDNTTPYFTTYLFLKDMWNEMDNNEMDRNQSIRNMAESFVRLVKRIEYADALCFDKNKVFLEVINRKNNEELLKTIPHRTFLDLAVTYRLLIKADDEEFRSVRITNEYLDTFSLTEDKLFQLAVHNMPKLLPVKVTNMRGFILKIESQESLSDMDKLPEAYIVSNVYQNKGAGWLLYKNVFSELAEKLDGDLHIYPSSIHELIVKKAEDDDYMLTLTPKVNETHVAEKQRLSNQVYYYSHELGDFFVVSHNKETII